MRKKSLLKKVLAVTLSLVIVASTVSAVFTAFAQTNTGNGNLVFEKISNPDAGVREADGLEPGGNRETSYAWSMAARGNYLYIGTNKNTVGGVAAALAGSLAGLGLSSDVIWAAIDAYTNGEIPQPTSTEGGYIFRCDQTTGEIKIIYRAPAGVAFRMAMEYDGDVYFASYSSVLNADNYIFRIDENDNVETVFTSSNGTSLRAACIHDDGLLYFGGVDAREELAPGDENCQKLAILYKDPTDDTKWTRVADYKDFRPYAEDPAVKSTITSPIWDICSYDGYIYATIPNSGGFVMYRGHAAAEGETANEYGWYWEEIVGKYNGVNNVAFADTPEGYVTGPEAGMISMTATPFTFKGDLYVMDFDNTITSEIMAVSGIIAVLFGQNDVKLSTYLEPLYTTLQNPQSLWRYNTETGKFDEVDSFTKLMEGTCNEYLWRTAVYNDELYISTMDSAILYNYVTRLTNGSFLQMTEEEFADQISYLKTLLSELGVTGNSDAVVEKIIDLIKKVTEMFESFKDMDLDDAQAFLDKYQDLIDKILNMNTIDTLSSELSALTPAERSGLGSLTDITDALKKIKDILGRIDIEGLKMYIYISNTVADDVWGFDIIKTADGENFEIVTDDGFGDKYNYGGRSLLATEQGLYVGTANPFYGAQLWRITSEGDEPTTDEPTTDEPTTDEPVTDEPTTEEPATEAPSEDTTAQQPSTEAPSEDTTADVPGDSGSDDSTDVPATGSSSDIILKMAIFFGSAAVVGTVAAKKRSKKR